MGTHEVTKCLHLYCQCILENAKYQPMAQKLVLGNVTVMPFFEVGGSEVLEGGNFPTDHHIVQAACHKTTLLKNDIYFFAVICRTCATKHRFCIGTRLLDLCIAQFLFIWKIYEPLLSGIITIHCVGDVWKYPSLEHRIAGWPGESCPPAFFTSACALEALPTWKLMQHMVQTEFNMTLLHLQTHDLNDKQDPPKWNLER